MFHHTVAIPIAQEPAVPVIYLPTDGDSLFEQLGEEFRAVAFAIKDYGEPMGAGILR